MSLPAPWTSFSVSVNNISLVLRANRYTAGGQRVRGVFCVGGRNSNSPGQQTAGVFCVTFCFVSWSVIGISLWVFEV